ncbi:MAG: hypothetical protein ACOH2H_16070 [Cypionkella sp.]
MKTFQTQGLMGFNGRAMIWGLKMVQRKNPAYSKADLKRWAADMTLRRPTAPPGLPLIEAVQVVSFTLGEMDTGMLLIIRNAHNETQTLFLNPLLAEALRSAVLTAGQAGNWLDATGEIIPPTLSL